MIKLVVENISKHFQKNGLSTTSFSFSTGDFLCITGESGCGKTTLLNIITGMLTPDTGEVYLNDKSLFRDISEKERTLLRRTTLGYIIQGNALIADLTVWQNIIAPTELSGQTVDEEKIYNLTDRLGISGILDSYPSVISGGEYRRAMLARVLLLDTELLIVDEPTSNLDEKSAVIVRDVLYNAYKNGKGLLVVTHDKNFLDYQPRTLELTK